MQHCFSVSELSSSISIFIFIVPNFNENTETHSVPNSTSAQRRSPEACIRANSTLSYLHYYVSEFSYNFYEFYCYAFNFINIFIYPRRNQTADTVIRFHPPQTIRQYPIACEQCLASRLSWRVSAPASPASVTRAAW